MPSAHRRRLWAWLTRRPTDPRRGRSRTRRASTGSATSTAGSSTSARPSSLRSRLSSYFQDLSNLHPRTQTMVTTAAAVDWTVVATEVEALQLEYSWIKEFDPRFNVRYRDDKSYPSLAVTLNEEFPRLQVMRGPKTQGRPLLRPLRARLGDPRDARPAAARLPGPHLLQRRLQARRPGRPALPARLHRQVLGARASAGSTPRSTGRSSRTSATSWPAQTVAYLRRLEKEMQVAAANQEYERAARLRDDIKALERAMEKQAVVLGRRHRRRRHRVRRGPARGGRPGLLRPRRAGARPARLGGRQGRGRRPPATWSSDFLQQVYGDEMGDSWSQPVPREVLVPVLPDDAAALAAWLCGTRGAAGSTSGCRSAATSAR